MTKTNEFEGKQTVSLKNNDVARRLLTKSLEISEESSKDYEDSRQSVEEIDPLFIKGQIGHLRAIDEATKSKYGISQAGEMFDVDDHTVILVGRHRIGLKDGQPVGLYAPSYFKSARDKETGKVEVLVQRKLKD